MDMLPEINDDTMTHNSRKPKEHFMSKNALIIGIAGQDGSYLAEHLLEKGYEVQGILRRNSTPGAPGI